MQLRYLPALVMLIAGAVGCGFGIYKSIDLNYFMKMELIIMIIFFFVGKVAAKLINSILKSVDDDGSGIQPQEQDNGEENKET